MTLTIAQLEDALWCAHKAKEHFYMTANSERADKLIVALEAEIARLEQDRDTCPRCHVVIFTTDDHLSRCRSSEWLPPREGK